MAVNLSGCGKSNSPEKAVHEIDTFLHQSGGLKDAKESITDANYFRAGDSIGDWLMITENRAGNAENNEKYLAELEKYVTACYQTEEKLDRVKATEWHRITLAVLAAGGDPTAFGNDPEGDPVDLVKEGTYGWEHTESLDDQGSNGLMYALIVLNAGGYEVPADAIYPKARMIEELLAYQDEDGSFGLAQRGGDTDMTAMAIQALAPMREDPSKYPTGLGSEITVQESVDRALDFLSGEQRDGGYYAFGNQYSSDTCSQVILALCAAGINPEADERFAKGGRSVVDALYSFRNEDGGYASSYDRDGELLESDVLASRQAMDAFTAMILQKDGVEFFSF